MMYVPSRLKLSAVYFYLGEMYKARSIIEEAKQLEPQNPEVLAVRALIIYREDPNADLWTQTAKTLEDLAQKPDCPLFVRYNLSVLLEKRGRTGNALDIWKSLAEQTQKIPILYHSEIFKKARIDGLSAAKKPSELPWTVPFYIGADILDKNIGKSLEGWQKIEFDWHQKKLAGHIYQNADNLKTYCNAPLYESSLSGGMLYSCDSSDPQWAALVQDGRVSEI